ncbi:MAG: SDR family oxidoreductase [Nanoarchaeota archaeon]
MTNHFDLQGRTIIITGALGVLGRHLCKILSENNANTVIADLDGANCEKFAEELSTKHKTDPLGITLDLTSQDSITTCITSVMKKYKHIDVLINCARTMSKNYFAKFEDYSRSEWDEVMDVNLTGAIFITQEAIKHMKKGASIINISSIYGNVGPTKQLYEGMPNHPAPAVYSVAKGGLAMFSIWLAAMYGDKGIRANTITIGGISEHQLGGSAFEKVYAQKTPLKRMATLADVTGPILFLASDASSYVTGHDLVVDGGWTII